MTLRVAELMALGRVRGPLPVPPPGLIAARRVRHGDPKPWVHAMIDYQPDPRCWLWRGRIDGQGYGKLCVGGMEIGAHRYMYRAVHGPASVLGMHVHHHCEVKRCVNPSHLEAMTPRAHAAWHYLRIAGD